MTFYGTRTDADSYHAARGNAEWAAATPEKREAALTVASDWVDGTYASRAQGLRTGGRSQERAWPRKGVVVDGEELPDDEVPAEVEQTTYQAAYLHLKGIKLNYDGPPSQGAITKKHVKGGPAEVTTEYATVAQADRPSFTALDDLMSALMSRGNTGAMVGLLRG